VVMVLWGLRFWEVRVVELGWGITFLEHEAGFVEAGLEVS
jgi:hypothetical protein